MNLLETAYPDHSPWGSKQQLPEIMWAARYLSVLRTESKEKGSVSLPYLISSRIFVKETMWNIHWFSPIISPQVMQCNNRAFTLKLVVVVLKSFYVKYTWGYTQVLCMESLCTGSVCGFSMSRFFANIQYIKGTWAPMDFGIHWDNGVTRIPLEYFGDTEGWLTLHMTLHWSRLWPCWSYFM